MMPFTVGWYRSAEDMLAVIWMAAPDRQAVTQADHRIQVLLRNSSHYRGNDTNGVYARPFDLSELHTLSLWMTAR